MPCPEGGLKGGRGVSCGGTGLCARSPGRTQLTQREGSGLSSQCRSRCSLASSSSRGGERCPCLKELYIKLRATASACARVCE